MQIKDDHVVIETAEEAACFGSVYVYHFVASDGYLSGITLGQLKEAITPKDGDAVFWWSPCSRSGSMPWYITEYNATWVDEHTAVKANALTIGKTCGELRAMLKLCGKGDEATISP